MGAAVERRAQLDQASHFALVPTRSRHQVSQVDRNVNGARWHNVHVTIARDRWHPWVVLLNDHTSAANPGVGAGKPVAAGALCVPYG